MAIDAKILSLLKRRGYTLTDGVREALEEFLIAIAEARDATRMAGGDDDEDGGADAGDEDAGEEEELATTRYIACPHCGERIGIAIDLSGDDQDAVQDCEVCCSPIRISYTVSRGRLGSFSAEAS